MRNAKNRPGQKARNGAAADTSVSDSPAEGKSDSDEGAFVWAPSNIVLACKRMLLYNVLMAIHKGIACIGGAGNQNHLERKKC